MQGNAAMILLILCMGIQIPEIYVATYIGTKVCSSFSVQFGFSV